jgi:hypothetical protein
MSRFAVVQCLLDPPAPEPVMQAFAQTPGLTLEDGRFAARHRVGIIIEETQEDIATALAQSLVNNGIPAAAVPESELPDLPPAVHIRNVGYDKKALTLADGNELSWSFPWSKIRLIGAGAIAEVTHTQENQIRHVALEYTVTDESRVAHQVTHPMLLLMIGDELNPYVIESEHFDFACLGPRLNSDHERNLVLVLDDLLAYAPKTLRNRGAMRCPGDDHPLLPYDTRHSFEREVAWLLWLARQGPRPQNYSI